MSVYAIPYMRMIFLVISLTFSKVITLFTYTLFAKRHDLKSANDSTNDSKSVFVSIRLNPLTQIEDFDGFQQQSMALSINYDDEELIRSDTASIATSSFYENDRIELRLDQDMECDNDTAIETIN